MDVAYWHDHTLGSCDVFYVEMWKMYIYYSWKWFQASNWYDYQQRGTDAKFLNYWAPYISFNLLLQYPNFFKIRNIQVYILWVILLIKLTNKIYVRIELSN